MIGAIIGDIVGSRFEFHNHLSKDFEFLTQDCRFTDDTVMTCAVARALMDSKEDYSDLSEKTITAMQQIGQQFPNCGYGARFINWMFSDNPQPYNSCGNGSAMRISPVGFAARDVDEAKKLSAAVTYISHDHPEGMRGAEATAVAIVMAREGKSKDEIRKAMEEYYDLSMTVEEHRDAWQGHGKEICQISLPQALTCFFEGENYEDVIRNCISIGGDSDTIAAIAGGIADAYYGVPEEYWVKAERYLPWSLLQIVLDFQDWAKTIKLTSEIEPKEEISADDQHKLIRYVIRNGDNTDILAVGANSWDARATLLEYLEKHNQHVGVVINTYPGVRHDESAYIDYYVIGPANIFEQELKEHADAHQWWEKYYHYMENIDSKELMEWITSPYHYDEEIWTYYNGDTPRWKYREKRIFQADDRVVDCVDIEDENTQEWKEISRNGYYMARLQKSTQVENRSKSTIDITNSPYLISYDFEEPSINEESLKNLFANIQSIRERPDTGLQLYLKGIGDLKGIRIKWEDFGYYIEFSFQEDSYSPRRLMAGDGFTSEETELLIDKVCVKQIPSTKIPLFKNRFRDVTSEIHP